MKKITIIGHFGFGEELLNGQTVKTKIIASELEKRYGKMTIKKIDTRGNLIKRFFSFIAIIFSFFNSTDIIFLPAQKGIKFFAPLLTNLNIFFKRNMHYIAIGGSLYDFVLKNKNFLKFLKKINYIYVETNYILKPLASTGLKNLVLMPNCKRLNIINENELSINNSDAFRLCTFSRVSKAKGIDDAVNAVKMANKICLDRTFYLDIYGSVAHEEKDWFSELTKSFSSHIKYKGEVAFNKTTDVLASYDLLLFPTFYDGEGFAGTIIDALSAGLPVIASNWRSNPEIINNNIGRIFEVNNIKEMADDILELTNNSSLLLTMKKNCIHEAKKYEINCVMEILYNNIVYKKEAVK